MVFKALSLGKITQGMGRESLEQHDEKQQVREDGVLEARPRPSPGSLRNF